MSATALEIRAKQTLLHAFDEAEAQYVEKGTAPEEGRTAVVALLRKIADHRAVEGSEWRPQPLAFDFEADTSPPDWIVAGLIERGTVVVLSGDTGAAKSIVTSSLLPAALNDEDWIGRRTNAARVLVLDEENPDRLVTSRLKALGVENEHRDRLRYYSRSGLAVGDGGASDAWLRAELEEFSPDLLIIDTLMAACAVEDTNSNAEAVRVMKALRALAAEYGCAVLLLHHERKQSVDHPKSSGQAMMGARQWAGQADAHMTLTVESDLIEEGDKLRRTFKFRPAEKDRDGRLNEPRRLAVESEKDAAGRLLWMSVTDEGSLREQGVQDAHAEKIIEALRDGDLATGQIAQACGVKSADDGAFKRALGSLAEAGKIEKPKRGHYHLTAHGRETAGLAL